MPRKPSTSPVYQRRIARGKAKGKTLAQARGHAPGGDNATTPLTPRDRERFEAALKLYRQTRNKVAAAKAVHLAPERFARLLRENVDVEGRGSTLKITDRRHREMTVISAGEKSQRVLRDFDQASLNSQHLNAVTSYLTRTNDPAELAPFVGRAVIDAKGVEHALETDPNVLHEIAHAGDDAFHEIYRLVI